MNMTVLDVPVIGCTLTKSLSTVSGATFRITGKIHALNACELAVVVCATATVGAATITFGRNRPRIVLPTNREINARRFMLIRTGASGGNCTPKAHPR